MAHAATLIIAHNTFKGSKNAPADRLKMQVTVLRKALDEAREEIALLTAERDELVAALKEAWAQEER